MSFEYVRVRPFNIVSRPCRLPNMRPVLPRTSSAASGLRFWGMMELPVENSSGRVIKPNRGFAQIMISSASLDKCTDIKDETYRKSTAKSRSETPSMELPEGFLKPSSLDV